MRFVADLHLHSKYSRAVSPSMTLPVMAQFAREKGLDILSASDFTHPRWFNEIQEQLEEVEEGIYKLRGEGFDSAQGEKQTMFLLSTEISCIYKQDGKVRRVHNLIFVPSLEIAAKVNRELIKRGCNLTADGRPIVGISSKNLLELLLTIDERCLLIPCHVWTPHFGVYGSKSGFDSLDEAFGELAPYVYGIETGISSDPEMNWRIGELANRSILSFSDAHSAANMGREATVFELEAPTYENLRKAIMRKGNKENKLSYTIEFYPEEGKYHFSGHRNCKIAFTPEQIQERGNVCPVCGHTLTEGVLYRIEQMGGITFADSYKEIVHEGIKWYEDTSQNHPPYVKLVRLPQIIAAGVGTGDKSKKVQTIYANMISALGSELTILLTTSLVEIERVAGAKVAEGVSHVRSGAVSITPGYDGVYGKVKLWDSPDDVLLKGQMSLEI